MKGVLVCGSVLCLVLSGCSATTLVATSSMKTELVQEPAIGQERTAEVGDTLVKTAKVTQAPALYLKTDVHSKGTGNWAGLKATVPQGLLLFRYSDPAYNYFMKPEPVTIKGILGQTFPAEVGIGVSRRNPSNKAVMVNRPQGNAFYNPIDPIDVEETVFIDKSAPGFSQELLYNGKAGDTVKFLTGSLRVTWPARPSIKRSPTTSVRGR